MARRNRYTGKYKLDKHEFLKAYHHAMCYNEWRKEYNALLDTSKAIIYDDMPHGCNTKDTTAEAAEKREMLSKKMNLIEKTVMETEPDIFEYLLLAVTNEGITYDYLKTIKHIPCGKNLFYDRRRKFYYLLSSKI